MRSHLVSAILMCMGVHIFVPRKLFDRISMQMVKMVRITQPLQSRVELHQVASPEPVYFLVELSLNAFRHAQADVSPVHLLLVLLVHLDEEGHGVESNGHGVVLLHIHSDHVSGP